MGCGASSNTVEFRNGKPSNFKYNEIIPCFPDDGNGLAFRLVNAKKKQWAFYNDTKDYEMRISVTFGKGSEVTALGKTKVEKKNSGGEYVASVTVGPGETVLFIEGKVEGFTAKTDAIPVA